MKEWTADQPVKLKDNESYSFQMIRTVYTARQHWHLRIHTLSHGLSAPEVCLNLPQKFQDSQEGLYNEEVSLACSELFIVGSAHSLSARVLM